MTPDRRIKFLLRRGLRELDVLLERYYQRRYDSADAQERGAFIRLLEREDPDIQLWILRQSPVPPEFQHVIEQLRRHD